MSQPLRLSADSDPAAFVADLRDLRARAGAPSYATLARRTGLPRSTIYDALHRAGLPALALTLALVHAFGGDEAGWQERWATLRSQLDGPADVVAPLAPVETARAEGTEPPWYRRRFWLVISAAVVGVGALASGLRLAVVRYQSDRGRDRSTMYRLVEGGLLLDASRRVVTVLAAGDLVVESNKSTGP